METTDSKNGNFQRPTTTTPSNMTPSNFSFSMKISSQPAPSNIPKKNTVMGQESEKLDEPVDYVTGISQSGLTSLHPEQEKGPLVIPLPPQTPTTKINTKYLGLAKKKEKNGIDGEKEEAITNSVDPLDQEAIRGIIKTAKEENTNIQNDTWELPLLIRYRNPELDEIPDEDDRFKADVQCRPDESTQAEYENVPVEEFGTALLRGMGWAPGGPIGLTNPKVVEPIEFLTRPGYRTGLGATAKPPDIKTKKYIKPGESRTPKEREVLPPDASGRVRHYKTLDEKLVPESKLGIRVGVLVSIIAGRHEGLIGRVQKILDQQLTLRLESSHELQWFVPIYKW